MATTRLAMNQNQCRLEQTAPAEQASGIYSWVIETDTVYCDSLVAEAFGLNESQARNGLPIKAYLDRIHPDDLPRVARSIHETLTTSRHYSEQYRACHPDGSIVQLMAFGCCFRDSMGEPTHYCGVIFPSSAAESDESAILSHLLSAHDLAKQAGQAELADNIVRMLVGTDGEELDTDSERRH